MNWQFFQEIVKAMGFLTKWIQWTFTLYENARTNVLVNGAIVIDEFSMERGVKQGCPLPHIFIS
jgi:hypothetical protein